MPLLSSLSTIVITFIIGFIIMVVVFVGSDVLLTPVGKYSLLKFVYRQVRPGLYNLFVFSPIMFSSYSKHKVVQESIYYITDIAN